MMMVKNHNNDDERIANLMQPTRPCEVPMFAGALEIISLLILLTIIAHDDDCSTLSVRSIPQYLRRFRFHLLDLVGGSL